MTVSVLSKYKENKRIEAKKATGGLPRSIWETYSAFANTSGGVILLGVLEDKKDRTLYPVDLPDTQRLISQILEGVNDSRVVNKNILAKNDVRVDVVDGKEIVVIRVPRAKRIEKPIYIGGNPFMGTYKRVLDADIRCDENEVEKMLADAARED